MKKLDEIPKQNIFQVPEKYFDELPGIIQTRTSSTTTSPRAAYFTFAIRYALPALTLTLALVLWFNYRQGPDDNPGNAEEMLASIDTASLVSYLEENGITTEDLIEAVDLSANELSEIENTVYGLGLDEEDVNALMNEYSYELNDL